MARPTTPNIIDVFNLATDDEITAGRDWYRNAKREAERLAESRIPIVERDPGRWTDELQRAVAVLAVLSPRLHWDRNVEAARQAYEAHAFARGHGGQDYIDDVIATWPGLKGNARKAFAVLDGGDLLDIVKGEKVTAFYYAILDSHDPRGIVIDRHAFDVAVGRVMDDATRGKVLGLKGAYARFVRAYERATRALSLLYPGITPAEVQAITWVVWRRLKKEGKV